MTRKGYLGRQLTYSIQANDLKKTSLHCLKSGKPVRCTPRLRVR
jgi:hypothetical protein